MVDIASKKIQGEHPFSNKQLEQIIQKIKFFLIPKDLQPLTIYKEELVQDSHDGEAYMSKHVAVEKNTKERAIVRCRIPMKKVEEEFVEVDEATGEEIKRKVERMVEEEIDDRVQLIPSMVAGKDYTIYALNQPAPRNYRREIYSLMRKHFADFFDGRDATADQTEFEKRSEEIYEQIEAAFIEDNKDDEKLPLFDFDEDVYDVWVRLKL